VDIIDCLGGAAMMFVWRGTVGEIPVIFLAQLRGNYRGAEGFSQSGVNISCSWCSWRTIQAEGEVRRVELWMRSTVEHITRRCSLKELGNIYFIYKFT
jgi:hypothetical protein